MAHKLVIVESPAKAKTINKYLGNDYKVIASFGHIRDLPSKDGSVKPDQNFEMIWQIPENSKKHFNEIKKYVKDAECIYLATDPDREGEAISWHIIDALHQYKSYRKIPYKRITFNEITKKAVQYAIEHPRDLDQKLIDAYLARLSLDYLVGFNLSPILWRKLPGSRSAGRVQSVALKLICEREFEIEAFKAEEYWSVHGIFEHKGKDFEAKLSLLKGEKIEKFSLKNEQAAQEALKLLRAEDYHIDAIEAKEVKRNPYAPFTTSTLQQDASHKLGFGTSKTMRLAQRLYEGVSLSTGETTGLITYMRTDGVQISDEAITSIRAHIEKQYGASYLPASKRIYKTKAKNAQEAHEAIRPTAINRTPESLKQILSDDELKLYTLIWRRTLASQMESARIEQVRAEIRSMDKKQGFRATGSTVKFDGFYKIYQDNQQTNKSKKTDESFLPPLSPGDKLKTSAINSEQHFTQPPARYSEAGLVKKLEELGIGRPSTYASIIKVLQDRDYVTLDNKRFVPETRGRLVTSFLDKFFANIMLYDFTAELEEKLDEISDGKRKWRNVLAEFWQTFNAQIEDAHALKIQDVLTHLDKVLEKHFFGENLDRTCPKCKTGTLHLKLGKFGSFAGCSNYPDCDYAKPLERDASKLHAESAGEQAAIEPQILGNDPLTGVEISLRKGPYGFYVQKELTEEEKQPRLTKTGKPSKRQPKPRRMSLLKGMRPDEVTLEIALKLLELPKTLGTHPETGLPIKVSIGRFGPYIHYNDKFKSIPASDDILTLNLERAIEILNTPSAGRGGRNTTKTEALILAKHPDDQKEITYHEGPYGPYIKHDKLNASLPKDKDPKSFSVEELKALLDAQAIRKKKKSKTAS